ISAASTLTRVGVAGSLRRLRASSQKTLRMFSRCASAECIGTERSCLAKAMLWRFAPKRTGQPKNSLNSSIAELRRWIKVRDCGTIGKVGQTPDLGNKCGSAPLCNMLLQALQARPECCVDGDVSAGFLDCEGCCRVHEAMVPNQIFDGVQRGASSGKYRVNNAQLPCVGFHRQMRAKTIVADQLGDLIDECNAL